MSWPSKENWRSITIQVGLVAGTIIATTMAVAAQTITDRCKPGTIATLELQPEWPIAWMLIPIFVIGIIVILCGFVAALIGMISLFLKGSGNERDTAAMLKFQERFFYDPSFRINRLLIGWGFSSFATVTFLLFLVGVTFGERC